MEKKTDEAYGVVTFCVDEAGIYKVLLLRHAYGTKHWSLPKGHKEGSESEHDAAFRELKEETGLTSYIERKGKSLSETYSFEQNGVEYDKTVTYFFAEISCEEEIRVQQEEIQEYRWVSVDEYGSLDLYDTQKILMARIFQQLTLIDRKQ